MSYQTLSIKETLEKINSQNNGWYLPQTQRRYVWGSRHNSEAYVCALFDSILKRYPIGTMVIWETTTEVPHHEFMGTYSGTQHETMVDPGRWGANKGLVYDGQQRLQTLFSCLRYSFKEKILCYDLCFNDSDDEPGETGFSLENADNLKPSLLRMTELFVADQDKKFEFRESILSRASFSDAQKKIIEKNLDRLWGVFVNTDIHPIAYFPVRSDSDKQVNDIFMRLNTGGMSLSQTDLLFSRINAISPGFDDSLKDVSDQIRTDTQGYEFSPDEILQLIYLLIFKTPTVRGTNDRLQESDIQKFLQQWKDIQEPLIEFFRRFMFEQFRINDNRIIIRKLALLPVIAYLVKLHKQGVKFQRITAANSSALKQYFILSQLNDWNMATLIGDFIKSIDDSNDFPIEKLKTLADKKRRRTTLRLEDIDDCEWFFLKILSPTRTYVFSSGRSPEIDHIFPQGLKGQDEQYKEMVNTLWNYQAVSREVNNFKRRQHPKKFFNSENGNRYIGQYDYLPDPSSSEWDSPNDFIDSRKKRMLKALEGMYGLVIQNPKD